MTRPKSSATNHSRKTPRPRPRAARHQASPDPAASPKVGIVQWFRFGDREHVEQVLDDLNALGVHQLRTGVSWADYHRPGGVEWYDWLMPRVAEAVEVLPCFMYTPPSIAMTPKSSAPPQDPQDYANFLDLAITRYGVFFDWLELWNDPSNINNWDWRLDPDWNIFCDMISRAAYWARQRGKHTVLAGVSPSNFSWLRLLCDRKVLEQIDVIGVRCYPGTWEHESENWSTQVETLGERLASIGCQRPIWITETGYSTWQNDEPRQLTEFAKLLDAPVERVYWYSAEDLHPDTIFQEGVLQDERQFHFGLKRIDRSPKLLYRVWSDGGLEAVRAFAGLAGVHTSGHAMPAASVNGKSNGKANAHQAGTNGSAAKRPHAAPRFSVKHGEQYVLVTGGAGFIGTNVAARLADEGHRVLVYDNLSRPGVEQNMRWLLATYPGRITVEVADVRDPHSLRRAVTGASRIYHFAAQVAVTTSLVDPTSDFETNARGTLNLLEACRQLASPPPLLFTSTNKVYGNLEDVELRRQRRRYAPVDAATRRHGISELQPLAFHSPYGCSKGTADQYVLDYARCYDLPAVVFRMSCIYGPHQCGNEDQGWVAHFVRRALRDEPITFYGDGRQVRDLLYADDLVEAMLLAIEHIDETAGHAFNIGGGPANAASLLEVVSQIEELHEHAPAIRFAPWRSGDQRYYVSDTRAFQEVTGWKPQYGVRQGIEQLYHWLDQHGAALLAAATA